jgi:hypothetical protein
MVNLPQELCDRGVTTYTASYPTSLLQGTARNLGSGTTLTYREHQPWEYLSYSFVNETNARRHVTAYRNMTPDDVDDIDWENDTKVYYILISNGQGPAIDGSGFEHPAQTQVCTMNISGGKGPCRAVGAWPRNAAPSLKFPHVHGTEPVSSAHRLSSPTLRVVSVVLAAFAAFFWC